MQTVVCLTDVFFAICTKLIREFMAACEASGNNTLVLRNPRVYARVIITVASGKN